jgi:DNA repair protein RadD
MQIESAALGLNFGGGTYRLRDYQQNAVDAGLRFFRNEHANYGALMVLPTGSGKSLVIAGIAEGLNKPTLIFQPSKEILEQNYEKLRAFGLQATIYSASLNSKKASGLTLATIGSVINNKNVFSDFEYVIIDECHYVNAKGGMYRDFLAEHKDKVLGMTATPYRLVTDGFGGSILKFLTRTRPRVFEIVIHITQNQELFDRGYLARLEYKQSGEFDSGQLRLNSTGADYADSSVRSYYQQIGFGDRLYNAVADCLLKGRKNILVFTRFIEESQNLINRLNGVAEIVTGETPKRDRESIINRFRGGETKVVSNVGVLTHGFDFPELETVVMARPTMSLGLYYQMIGRGIRIHPQKESTWVIDLCDNYRQFGRIEDLRMHAPKPGLWIISSNDRQLTNIYYGERNFSFKNTGKQEDYRANQRQTFNG